MSNNMESIKQRYSHEIIEIQNRLNYLEQRLITELKGTNMYGGLSINIQKLRKVLNDLLSKIINESNSATDKIF